MKIYAVAKISNDGEILSYYNWRHFSTEDAFEDNLNTSHLIQTIQNANYAREELYKDFYGMNFAVLEFNLSEPKIMM